MILLFYLTRFIFICSVDSFYPPQAGIPAYRIPCFISVCVLLFDRQSFSLFLPFVFLVDNFSNQRDFRFKVKVDHSREW